MMSHYPATVAFCLLAELAGLPIFVRVSRRDRGFSPVIDGHGGALPVCADEIERSAGARDPTITGIG